MMSLGDWNDRQQSSIFLKNRKKKGMNPEIEEKCRDIFLYFLFCHLDRSFKKKENKIEAGAV
jgi:hypothetical protein